MSATPKLSIGYFEDFDYGDPAILIWGDAGGLETFAQHLRDLCTAEARDSLLQNLPGIRTVHDATIELEIIERSTGMFRSESVRDTRFHWGLSPSRAIQFADLITAIAESDHACHQYLDTDATGEITVIASKGEYPETFPW